MCKTLQRERPRRSGASATSHAPLTQQIAKRKTCLDLGTIKPLQSWEAPSIRTISRPFLLLLCRGQPRQPLDALGSRSSQRKIRHLASTQRSRPQPPHQRACRTFLRATMMVRRPDLVSTSTLCRALLGPRLCPSVFNSLARLLSVSMANRRQELSRTTLVQARTLHSQTLSLRRPSQRSRSRRRLASAQAPRARLYNSSKR